MHGRSVCVPTLVVKALLSGSRIWCSATDSILITAEEGEGEATAGIEPAIGVLQTPALTTWPRRPENKMVRRLDSPAARRADPPATDQSNHVMLWSGRPDSNRRPSPWQGDALPLSHFRLVPRGRIELPTPQFSVACSTN